MGNIGHVNLCIRNILYRIIIPKPPFCDKVTRYLPGKIVKMKGNITSYDRHALHPPCFYSSRTMSSKKITYTPLMPTCLVVQAMSGYHRYMWYVSLLAGPFDEINFVHCVAEIDKDWLAVHVPHPVGSPCIIKSRYIASFSC